MKEQYRRLMQGFVESRSKDPEPDDLLEAVRGLPEVGQLPPPWVTWTLARLVRRLGSGSMKRISWREHAAWRERVAASGAGSREQGTVDARPDPGYPLFAVELYDELEEHTRYGYSFWHRSPDAENDHWWDPIKDWKTDRPPFVFVPEFLGGFAYSYTIDLSEGRSIPRTQKGYIEPSTATAELGVAELEADGLVERVLIREGSFGHSLTPAARELAASIVFSSCGPHVTPAKNVWLAAAIGDWPAAHAAAIDMDRHDGTQCPELVAFARERAGRCRARRDADPRARGQVCDIATAMLRGGYPSESRQFSEEFWEAIRLAPHSAPRKPPGWVGHWDAPLAVTEFRTDEGGDDVSWPPGVQRMLEHAACQARAACRPSRLIERRCHGATPRQRREIIRVFARDETMLGEAAYRAFIDAPEQAEALLRRGLRSPSLRSRIYTAGLLGAIDEPWSRRELWQAVQELADPKETVNLLAAMGFSRDWDVRRAVEAWEAAHGQTRNRRYGTPAEDCPVLKQVSYYRDEIKCETYPNRFRPIGCWGRDVRRRHDR